jgi:phosphoglycolate phosphatase-like HAD superfamily hydrolase
VSRFLIETERLVLKLLLGWDFLGQIRGVAFDLDGTLIISHVDFKTMKEEIIRLFGDHGIDQTLFNTSELTYVIIRRGLSLLSSRGIPDSSLRRIGIDITGIMNRVELESIPKVEAMPGVTETLLGLKDHGVTMGIITRGCRAYTLTALKKIGISQIIDVVLARDDVEKPKPDPSHLLELMRRMGVDRDEIVLVGDHTTDYKCAQAAKVNFVGVQSGSTGLEDLIRGDPKATVIDGLEDLLKVLNLSTK